MRQADERGLLTRIRSKDVLAEVLDRRQNAQIQAVDVQAILERSEVGLLQDALR